MNLDGVWNLVLACRQCNRGTAGKFAQVPAKSLLERLHRRNNYLIDSHHPLRRTLIKQTGASIPERERFLQRNFDVAIDAFAISNLDQLWKPQPMASAVF